tara:strand:- start:186 stop:533 length:348 start_codon:yes stop_codon:yes gene_type:complete
MEQKITIKVNSTLKYLQFWNGVFNLTSTEVKVLAALVDAAAILEDPSICSAKVKKAAAKVLGLADFNTLNNYVKKMKDKRAIRKDGKNYILSRLLNLDTKKVEVNINWDERKEVA